MSPEQLLGQLAGREVDVVADFEAGLGTVLRLAGRRADAGVDAEVDAVVVVVEPTAMSIEVGRRAVEAVQAAGLGRLVVAANRVRDEADARRLREAFPGLPVVEVPDDPAIGAAERQGRSPLDTAPDAPAVIALVRLAGALTPAA